MPDDKPELSSTELIRQARESLAPPKREMGVSTHVEGPSIQDLLATPLSSDSLLPQRAVDYWDPEADESTATAWEQIDHAAAAETDASPMLPPKRWQPPVPNQPPAPEWLAESPAPARAQRAPRPKGPPAQPPRKATGTWRLLIFGFFAFMVLMRAVGGDDSPAPLEVGGCYDSSDLTEPVDCAQPHRVQVFAVVNLLSSNSDAGDRCFDEAVVLRDGVGFPASAIVPDGTFVGATGTPSTAAGNTVCYLESPAGALVGSVLLE